MTEEEIIKRINIGGKDTDAGIKALYQMIALPMLRFFVYRGVSGDDAKDILQNTFIKLVRGATTFTGEGTAKAWIWQIARNCLADHIRKKVSLDGHETIFDDEEWRKLEELVPDPNSHGSVVSVDECVSAGLEVFSRRMPDRAYVLTLQMDGLSIEDISQQIGRSAAATKEYLSQCKKRIQPFITHCAELLAE